MAARPDPGILRGMTDALTRTLFGSLLVLSACTGQLGTSDEDAGGVVLEDAGGVVLMDGSVVTRDSGVRDTGPVDSGVADTGVRDTGTPPADPCTASGPLAAPIAGCMPTPLPDTGDPAGDCVARINQFRHDCQCLPPLMRWTDGEACADMDAQYDSEHNTAHAGFRAGICDSGRAQNECPGWGSIRQTVTGCLQQMWDEGPGDFYGPPAHGHYINMSSTTHTKVACGFYDGSGGVWAVQNFR